MDQSLPPLISAELLTDRLGTSGANATVIVHVGTTMVGNDPYAGYLDRRLPSALYMSLDDDLADPPAPIVGRHPLPSPAAFQQCSVDSESQRRCPWSPTTIAMGHSPHD